MQLKFGVGLPDLADLVPHRGTVPERGPDEREITGSKGSIYYRAHSYHTKVPPEGIARLIEHYTDPGDIVVDPFAGSGMTGIACLMTGRRGVVSDLSPAAVHIAGNYTSRLDPDEFAAASERLLRDMAELEQSLYATVCPACDEPARTEYVVWSDVHSCPGCSSEMLFWQCALTDDGTVRREVPCPSCSKAWRKRELTWVRSVPVLASISCPHCGSRSERPVTESERSTLISISADDIGWWYPSTPFESWREMWRGQHRDQELATAADFFTPRNLHGLAGLWHAIDQFAPPVRHGLEFAFTSIVNRASKRYQWNPKRPTNVLSSTLYVASLSYEFNVFSLLRRKLKTIGKLYQETASLTGHVDVRKAAAQDLAHIPDESVDYVFTDPPFGSNIFYSDASFLWEAWLGDQTDPELETVVNRSVKEEAGGKDVQDYEKLMAGAFDEIARILRPNAWASVMFHNSDDEVWSALQRALDSAELDIASAVAFDKSQPSFKGVKAQVAGERVPSFDLVLHVRKRGRSRPDHEPAPTPDQSVREEVEARLIEHVRTATPSKCSTPYLHSLVMRVLLVAGHPMTGWGFRDVESLCERLFTWDGDAWRIREET